MSLLIDLGESPLPLTKPLNTLAKKPNYIMVSTKEVKPKKKINSNIGEQNIVKEKIIKIRLKAYTGFLANINN